MTTHATSKRHSQRRGHRVFLALLLLVLAYSTAAPAASAQWTVIDPAHIAKTIWNGKKLVDQITNQKRQIENEILMLRKLANPPWRAIAVKMLELDEVMRAGAALAYSMDNLTREFGVTFPGFKTYGDWSEERRRQFDRSLKTYSNVMLSLQRQGQHFQQSQVELQDIKARATGRRGQTYAIELGNTIGTFTAEELVLIRQLLATQANAQAVQNAYEINKEAQAMAMQQELYRSLATYDHPAGVGYTGILAEDQ